MPRKTANDEGEPSPTMLGTILERLDALRDDVGELWAHRDAELNQLRAKLREQVGEITSADDLNWLLDAATAVVETPGEVNDRLAVARVDGKIALTRS